MKLNIFIKVTGMVITAVLISCVSLFLVSNYFVSRGFDTDARENITLFQRVVEKQIDAEMTDLMQTTVSLSHNPAVVRPPQSATPRPSRTCSAASWKSTRSTPSSSATTRACALCAPTTTRPATPS